jgi:CRISPR-associated protein Cmr6
MIMPLYQSVIKNRPQQFELDSHRGLWYERFFNHYNRDNNWKVDKESKMTWVREIARGPCGDEEALAQHRLRLCQLARALKGDFKPFETTWHFATGLGLPHPVENGFAWHSTLGVPYLAGSAVKGLFRAWLDFSLEDDPSKTAQLKKWCGDQDQAGELIFFDALPIKPVHLTADVMTPHMGKWYQEGDKIKNFATEPEKLPADWHDPVPVPFLAVKPKTTFLFIIAPRSEAAAAFMKDAFVSLEEALNWLGAGAKTATGYGHMQFDQYSERRLESELNEAQAKREREKKAVEEQIEKERKRAQMSPLECEMEEIIDKQKGQMPDYIILLQALDKGVWENDEDKKVVAQSIRERMKQANKWKESSAARKPDRDKDYQRTKKVLAYLK